MASSYSAIIAKKRKLVENAAKVFENDLKDIEEPVLKHRFSALITVKLPKEVSDYLKSRTYWVVFFASLQPLSFS